MASAEPLVIRPSGFTFTRVVLKCAPLWLLAALVAVAASVGRSSRGFGFVMAALIAASAIGISVLLWHGRNRMGVTISGESMEIVPAAGPTTRVLMSDLHRAVMVEVATRLPRRSQLSLLASHGRVAVRLSEGLYNKSDLMQIGQALGCPLETAHGTRDAGLPRQRR